MKSRRIWAAVGWSALILVMCWIPRSWVEEVESLTPGGLELGRLNVDKLIHVALFAGFGFLWARALEGKTKGPKWRAVVAAGVAFAVISEAGQMVPYVGRSMHVLDLLADVIGLGLGIWADRKWPPRAAG